jgi:hypothetical protein
MKLSQALNEPTGTVSILYGHSPEAKKVIQDALDGKYDNHVVLKEKEEKAEKK